MIGISWNRILGVRNCGRISMSSGKFDSTWLELVVALSRGYTDMLTLPFVYMTL